MWILLPNIDLRCFIAKQFLSRIYALFWWTFYRPKKCVGVQKITNIRYDHTLCKCCQLQLELQLACTVKPIRTSLQIALEKLNLDKSAHSKFFSQYFTLNISPGKYKMAQPLWTWILLLFSSPGAYVKILATRVQKCHILVSYNNKRFHTFTFLQQKCWNL